LRLDRITQFLQGRIGLLLDRLPNHGFTRFQGAGCTARKGLGCQTACIAQSAQPILNRGITNVKVVGNVRLRSRGFQRFRNHPFAEIKRVRIHGGESTTELP
jgi:hypothetical protein